LGLGKDSIFSAELIFDLNNKNVYYIYQASRVSPQDSICSNWLDSSKLLGLEGDLTTKWERYRRSLIGSSIQLITREDELIFTGGDSFGHISVKNVYNALASKIWTKIIGGWRKQIWSLDCPQNIKLFTWLVIEDKIISWKNLQKRGWEGPGISHLCKGKRES